MYICGKDFLWFFSRQNGSRSGLSFFTPPLDSLDGSRGLTSEQVYLTLHRARSATSATLCFGRHLSKQKRAYYASNERQRDMHASFIELPCWRQTQRQAISHSADQRESQHHDLSQVAERGASTNHLGRIELYHSACTSLQITPKCSSAECLSTSG